METVKTQDISVNDLAWKIDYNAERCTMCGSCVASCTFKSIKVEVQRKSMTIGRSDALVSTDKAIADKLGIQYVC